AASGGNLTTLPKLKVTLTMCYGGRSVRRPQERHVPNGDLTLLSESFAASLFEALSNSGVKLRLTAGIGAVHYTETGMHVEPDEYVRYVVGENAKLETLRPARQAAATRARALLRELKAALGERAEELDILLIMGSFGEYESYVRAQVRRYAHERYGVG